MKTKFCSRCKQHKPLEAFGKRKATKDGLCCWCRDCDNQYKAEWCKKHPASRKKSRDKYTKTKPENNKLSKQKYREANRKKIHIQSLEYRKVNRDKIAKCRQLPASFKTYGPQLKSYDDIRNVDGFLEVRCTYCGRWYQPSNQEVSNRIGAINGRLKGEQRIYCCQACKDACPSYGQRNYWRGAKKATSREVNAWIRQKVLERDNYTCQICGAGIETQLHVHHIEPVALNPMEQLDKENMITLCKKCHINVHRQPGCRNHELICN